MILLALALLAAALWETPQRLVPLADGRKINLYCTGQGGPTVILEAGFGATTWSWSKVQPMIAATNRVCSYDRAGMGFSDTGPMPRDGRAVIADLAAVLKAAKVAPPYVLVGHSAGGMTMRLFADAYPRSVVGMVLIDPSIEGQFDEQDEAVGARVAMMQRCGAAAAAHALPSTEPQLVRCTPVLPTTLSPAMTRQLQAATLDPGHWQTEASEYAAIAGANTDELRAGRQDYGDLPIIVLTSGVSADADPRWQARHAALAARSTRGAQRTVAGASHNIMKDAPQAVVDAIAEVARWSFGRTRFLTAYGRHATPGATRCPATPSIQA